MYPSIYFNSYTSPWSSYWYDRGIKPLIILKDSDNISSPLPKYYGKSRRNGCATAKTISKKKKQYAKMESIRKESRKRNR